MTAAWIVAILALAAAGVLAWVVRQARARIDALQQAAKHAQAASAEQLEEAARLRDGLFRAVDDVLLVLDDKQAILHANAAAETMLGNKVVGKTLLEATRQPELEQLMQDAEMVRGEGVERRVEIERHIYHARAVVFDSLTGVNHVLVMRDVTEIQRLERARRELVSNISHELSTPITAIGLLAETLQDSADHEKLKRVRKMAANIRSEANMLAQLVQEMRDLSLIESGQMPVRMTPTDVRAMVQGSVELLLPLAENKQQYVQIEVPEGIRVWADELQIRRAIKNLVHNAVKFSPPGASVVVRTTTENDEAIISVSDNGPGIAKDDLPRIFERFFQGDRSRQGGTGLGLAIVRHIVMAHGGRAWVESEEGHGATFYIALVLTEPQPAAAPAEDATSEA